MCESSSITTESEDDPSLVHAGGATKSDSDAGGAPSDDSGACGGHSPSSCAHKRGFRSCDSGECCASDASSDDECSSGEEGGAGKGPCAKRRKQRVPAASDKRLPKSVVKLLKRWLLSPEHYDYPYPDEENRTALLAATGITPKQLATWFTNARKRLWAPRRRQRGEFVPANFTSQQACHTACPSAASGGAKPRCRPGRVPAVALASPSAGSLGGCSPLPLDVCIADNVHIEPTPEPWSFLVDSLLTMMSPTCPDVADVCHPLACTTTTPVAATASLGSGGNFVGVRGAVAAVGVADLVDDCDLLAADAKVDPDAVPGIDWEAALAMVTPPLLPRDPS